MSEGYRRWDCRRGDQSVRAIMENQPHFNEGMERAVDEMLDRSVPRVDFTECQTDEGRSGRHETQMCRVITEKGAETRACGPVQRPET
jgi:hypothetical protein